MQTLTDKKTGRTVTMTERDCEDGTAWIIASDGTLATSHKVSLSAADAHMERLYEAGWRAA